MRMNPTSASSLLFLVLAWSLSETPGRTQSPSSSYGGTASPFRTPPTVDGRIEPEEWKGALQTVGFSYAPTRPMLLARTGRSLFGFTKDRLYIAIESEYPPTGRDHSSDTVRDKDYVFDESIEIWLDPNRENRIKGEGDQRFYQMNANAAGGLYDISFDPRQGPDTGWNGRWNYASRVDPTTHLWTVELSLPWEDLGWEPGAVIGRTLGVLIARNFKMPWEQATWFPHPGAFVDWSRYALVELTPDDPVVAIQSLGQHLHKGRLQLEARIWNPGPPRTARVRLRLTSSDMPEVTEEKTLALPAGGDAVYRFEDAPDRLHEHAVHTLDFQIEDTGGRSFLRYGLSWTKAPERKWLYPVGPNPAMAFRFAYYPSWHRLRVRLDPRELDETLAASCTSATLVLEGPEGTPALERTLRWTTSPHQEEFDVGDLKDGDYTLRVAFPGWNDILTQMFTRVHFPFEGNTLGVTDEVLPPFSAVRVEGPTVHVVFRQYDVDGLGLWRSVRAAGNDSAGGFEELLAAPIALVADGVPLQGRGAFVEVTPQAAVFEGRTDLPSATIRTRTRTEVDGCMKVELTLSPPEKGRAGDPPPLHTLTLDIPLRDDKVPLWHVSTTGLRINPAGEIPRGEGPVWDSTRTPDGNWFGNFLCYLWLGAEERGLCWFADNDAGWVHAVNERGQATRPAQELIRSKGVLTLRVNLVQRPIVLTEPRRIVFGLMASPTKPMPEGWRLRNLTEPSLFNMGYATPSRYSAKAPWGNDFSIADWAYRQRTGRGRPTEEEIEVWKARAFPADMEPQFRSNMIQRALGPFLGSFRPGIAYYKMYFDEFHSTAQAHPETHVFQCEWSGEWHRRLLGPPRRESEFGASINVAGIVRSHQDFACWYAAEWIRRGIGCYFDNAFPIRAYDPLTTAAYRLPNGKIQPSAGIWARRDYLRRIWTLHRLLGPDDARPTMMIHMTNTQILPYLTWCDEQLDLEWKDAPDPFQTKYHHSLLRAETIGRQAGNIPYAIAHVLGQAPADQQRRATETREAGLMVHDIRPNWSSGLTPLVKKMLAFGYGQPDSRVVNYWDPQPPIQLSDPECKWLLVKRGPALQILLCTWNPKPESIVLRLTDDRLIQLPARVVNEDKPEEIVPLEEPLLRMEMPGYGFRLLRIEPANR